MRRFLATFLCDVRIQHRNGFYYASLFAAFTVLLLLYWIPSSEYSWIIPLAIFSNLSMNGFYFMGGLVLLEKGEGTLEAQTITPLNVNEYLASKVVTLSLLSVFESSLITYFAYGTSLNWQFLIAGIITMNILFCLFGFFLVIRYHSINEYLFPSIMFLFLFSVPIISFTGMWDHFLFYLHPYHASFLLLKASFQTIPTTQLAYAFLYSSAWIILLYHLCRNAFHRFVIGETAKV